MSPASANSSANKKTPRPKRGRWLTLLVVIAGVGLGWLLRPGGKPPTAAIPLPRSGNSSPSSRIDHRGDLVHLTGGRFTMGSTRGEDDARPAHRVTLSPFSIDAHEVTNARFAQFVEATGYITTAEQAGFSIVFDRTSKSVRQVEGANWRHPDGPDSTITGREQFPVVQVSWHDAIAYAKWAGLRLPSEAEWEFAARAGLHDVDYPWAAEEKLDGRYQANYWQGRFPQGDQVADGFGYIAPVGSFPASRYRVYDMAGNVAEWCANYYDADAYRLSSVNDPRGPEQGTERVIRGGSWLSTEQTGRRHTVWARDKLPPSAANNFTGFRCAGDVR